MVLVSGYSSVGLAAMTQQPTTPVADEAKRILCLKGLVDAVLAAFPLNLLWLTLATMADDGTYGVMSAATTATTTTTGPYDEDGELSTISPPTTGHYAAELQKLHDQHQDQEWVDSAAYQVYCQPELCLRYNEHGVPEPRRHVACAFNGSFSAQCPPGRMILGIDAQLRQYIEDLHNEARSRFALGYDNDIGSATTFAPAVRMPTMHWDDELANLAEIHVRNCKFKHDECRSTARFLHAGQNLATGSFYLEQDIFGIVRNLTALWYAEHVDAVQEVLDHYTREYMATIGHFTQMISDRSTSVGCGIVLYPQKLDDFVFKQVLYTCNYAITNIIGQPVYRRGLVAASGCVTGPNPAYPGLCSGAENAFIRPIPVYE
ncbi:venom allergen 5-like isoform X2 [Anopheles aquasalis]|uniref:venom allergen 5-like isoform X2 n=1 Tax=Anopheles aquasalis TaxID=42839 RepID=UPI00215A719B|nr:venom allergen 5-like isoform X2 [Anopheles aquasalis]